MLIAKTIRSGGNLGSIDIAINRPDPKQPPVGIYSAHIDNGDGIISQGVIGLWSTFTEVFRIKNCNDICIEYNGTWGKNIDGRYDFYTYDNPYILYTRTNNLGATDLLIQQSDGTPIILATGDITSISLCRGWRNLIDPTSDQGLIAAYVSSGVVYYRSLVYKDDKLTWDIPCELDVEYDNVVSVNVSRTNDYRVIFHGGLNSGEHYLAYSERCWAGFAVEPESVSRTSSPGSMSFTPINLLENNNTVEYISRLSRPGDISARTINHPNNIRCVNISDTEIKIIHNTDLITSNIQDAISNISVKSLSGVKYNILNIEQHRNYTLLKTIKFNNEFNDIVVKYNGEGGLSTILDEPISEFEVSFTPTDLVPDLIGAPVVTNIINIDNDEGVLYDA